MLNGNKTFILALLLSALWENSYSFTFSPFTTTTKCISHNNIISNIKASNSAADNTATTAAAKEKVEEVEFSRRSVLGKIPLMMGAVGFTTATTLFPVVEEANAKADCMTDCLKNCKLIAPKDPAYCLGNCKDYCDQDDRTDGLSGSKSSDGGEVGILGAGTVVKGEDKPPSFNLPGLDFNSDKGRKLIGY